MSAGTTTSFRIGLWGATSSGKTTYLAALKLATDWDPVRRWLVSSPDDREADKELNDWANGLIDDREFPQTTTLQTRELSWRFVETGARSPWRWPPRFLRRHFIDFLLTLQDVPGEFYLTGDRREAESEAHLQSLSTCDGLLFMFDPTRELNQFGARTVPADPSERNGYGHPPPEAVASLTNVGGYQFFQKALDRLAETAMGEDTLFERALPQFLAVCTTKLDEPAVFEFARSGGWVTTDPSDSLRRPVVEAALPSKRASTGARGDSRDLFEAIADNRVSKRISGAFHKDRVAYFSTSSLGYYIPEDRQSFDASDYHNAYAEGMDQRVRGRVRPLQILEPLLWLERSIRDRPQAAKPAQAPEGDPERGEATS